MTAIRVLDWRPLAKGALLGFAKVEFPSGMIISDVCVLSGEKGTWASPPSKPMIDRDGHVLRDDKQKIRYSPIIEFSSKDIRNKWSSAVIDALRAAHPEALPG